jgi:two-component system OmpR family response regulator
MRILWIEDDPVLREMVSRSLADAGHRVDAVSHLADARQLWALQGYDAVLLDLNLPLDASPLSAQGSGLDLLRSMRQKGDRTAVLVLTARNRTEERIAGLNAGADDYLGKPFDLAEVEARLRALARRSLGAEEVVQVGQLTLTRALRRLQLGPQELVLPAREYEVLCELLTPPGRVISKKELAEKLSGFDDLLGDNALEAFISRLRKKLHGSGASIRTLRGIGYVLEETRA